MSKKPINDSYIILMTNTTIGEDFLFIVKEPSAWPMVHFFMPALVAIYLNFNPYKLLTIIYVFESGEFLISCIPGLDYFAETTPADNLVSDILLGFLGWAFVTLIKPETMPNIPWYIRAVHVILVAGIHAALLAFAGLDNTISALIIFWALYVISTVIMAKIYKSDFLLTWSFYSFVAMGIITICNYLLQGYTSVITIIVMAVTTLIIVDRGWANKKWLNKYTPIPNTPNMETLKL